MRLTTPFAKPGKKDQFKLHFPDEPEYRPSLAEERQTLHKLAEVVSHSKKEGTIEALDPALANLVKLDEEGLLDPYIVLARANAGIAKDYPAYREKNREKLFLYLTRYVASM